MIPMPDDFPDDPVLLRQILLAERRAHQAIDQAHHRQIVDLKEQIKLMRDRLFGCKSEQTVDSQIPQLVLFNEADSIAVPIADKADEESEKSSPRPSAVANASHFPPICRVSRLSMNFLSMN